MIKTFIGGVHLPVNPLEELSFSYSANNQRFEIVAIGEVTKIGSRGLIKTEIKSLFTDGAYPFVLSADLPAGEYVGRVQDMFDAREPVRLIVSGDGVDINLRCSLESFKYTKPFGEIEDYYYTLSLLEYRAYSAQRITVKPTMAAQAPKTPVRPEAAPKPKTHTAIAGDTLWGLAQRYYGDGSQYTKIWEANKHLNPSPNHIYVGQTFVIP
jgi:nucleoid-associated protein YgaU